jgi:type IV pilus assembly protein PilY1
MMYCRVKISFIQSLLFKCAIVLGCAVCVPTAIAVDISDQPLDIQIRTPGPMIMLVWDDSSSMDGEFMTSEPDGLFNGRKYLFPDNAYAPSPDHVDGVNQALNDSHRSMWRSRWSGYNLLYYDPGRTYHPWPSTRKHTFAPADLQQPWSNPTRTQASDSRLLLSGAFAHVFSGDAPVTIPHAHYFVFNDVNANGRKDDGEAVYVVAWQDKDNDGRLDLGSSPSDDRRAYFRIVEDDNGRMKDELIPVLDEKEKNALKPVSIDPVAKKVRFLTDREDLQNFANWFTYHRRREFVGKAVAAQLVKELRRAYVGIYALNRAPRIGVESAGPVHDQIDGREDLLDTLYAAKSEGRSLLRHGLDQVGRYFDQSSPSPMGPFPFKPEGQGGSCQAAHAVIISDGFRNDDFSGVGNADGDQGSPFADVWNDTLADVAMHYYKKDLSLSLTDQVPGGICDHRRHQRMRTHAFSFGLQGTLPDPALNGKGVPLSQCAAFSGALKPDWPRPEAGKAAMTDDLRHAVLNGRGILFQRNDVACLIDELITGGVRSDWICSSGAVVDNLLLERGTFIFQAHYLPGDWIGEVSAFIFDPSRPEIDLKPEKAVWRASDYLLPTPGTYDLRRIVTLGGSHNEPEGAPFRYGDLCDGQKLALGSDLTSGSAADRKASELLDYVRGREFPHYRKRSSLLGDIVHSAPVRAGKTLFAGANDGMLHALDVKTGRERFAYVPTLIFQQLHLLGSPDYAANHRFYVDSTPYVGEVLESPNHLRTYLIGGLGKGGKGYYCLRLQERWKKGADQKYETIFSVDDFNESTSEEEISRAVMWEYPACPEQGCATQDVDPDIGFSFGQAYVVNANGPRGRHRSVAIFGNGYNSISGKAVLYILDAASGKLIRKIDTGAGDDNGLSVPALVDVNLDRRVDYVYAGDLNGNLWKFDLTGEQPHQWGISHGEDLDRNGVIDALEGDQPQPVFQAGKNQPITGRPDVMSMAAACAPGASGYLVVFGTGRFLGAPDVDDVHQQSVYAVRDYGDDKRDSLGHFTNRSQGLLSSGLLLAQRRVTDQFTPDGQAYRALTDSTCDDVRGKDNEGEDGPRGRNSNLNPTRCAGWFFDFPVPPEPHALPGERVTGKAVIRDGRIVIVSYAPSHEPCASGGHSWVYHVNACGTKDSVKDGTVAEGVPSQRYAGRINEPVAIIKNPTSAEKDVVLGSDRYGRMIMMEIPGEKWGKVFWQHSLFD